VKSSCGPVTPAAPAHTCDSHRGVPDRVPRLPLTRAGNPWIMRRPRAILDNSLPALAQGYTWLPAQRSRSASGVAHTRVLGQRAVGLCGPDAARFFYDEDHIRRHTAIPWPVQSTLFGHGAVHTLDGEHHRVRKSLFHAVVTPDATAGLLDDVAEAWDDAVASWPADEPVVLFDEAARIICRGVCRRAGVPLADADVPEVARDLVAMVDGFATPGPRHWRARAARNRREAWLGDLVTRVRSGEVAAPAKSALDIVAHHREPDGDQLNPRLAAVELLNVIRPTVAVAWFWPTPATLCTAGPSTARSCAPATSPTPKPSRTSCAGSTRSRPSSAGAR
jgi:fatty-acid peroxygenase